MTEAFALLDDQTPGATSRLYTGLVTTHRCTDPATLAAREGTAAPGPVATEALTPAIDAARHARDIARIQAAIADGETYQVNHTYRWHGRLAGEPLALYRRLRDHQGVAFGALLHAPDAAGAGCDWVLSRSPELFVRHEAGRLTAQPMKGTLPAEAGPGAAATLQCDAKNRAENLMIVDLLRNDLGRIAVPGSVRVPELFAVQRLATVFQMTSTVTARRRPEAGLAALLRALFPCGSVTGAPKRRTMDWIAALETTPRGLYCGAIGWLDAPADAGAPCPDLCLSVTIRTLTLGPAHADGTRPLTLATGGGIVADSDAASEWEESRWKARFLTTLEPGFELFETMRAEAGRIVLCSAHRARLAASAAALGFAFDPAAFDAALDALLVTLPADPHRVRAALAHDGRLTLTHAALAPLPPGPVSLRWADAPLPATRPLPRHKTTLRAAYDAGVRAAEAQGDFDTLFLDEEGHLLEGGRSSVFVQLDGRWFTPPLADGVLPGVMRGQLLAGAAWAARERRLTRADVEQAQALVVCNALRGALPARLRSQSDTCIRHGSTSP